MQIEARLEKKGPIITREGNEITLKVPPSKYLIKRQELRDVVSVNKRFIFYFRLTEKVYGKACVIDLKPVYDSPASEKEGGPDQHANPGAAKAAR